MQRHLGKKDLQWSYKHGPALLDLSYYVEWWLHHERERFLVEQSHVFVYPSAISFLTMVVSYYSTCLSVPLVRNDLGSEQRVWHVQALAAAQAKGHCFTNLTDPKPTVSVLSSLACWDEWKIPFASCEFFFFFFFSSLGNLTTTKKSHQLLNPVSISGFTKLNCQKTLCNSITNYLPVELCMMGDYS